MKRLPHFWLPAIELTDISDLFLKRFTLRSKNMHSLDLETVNWRDYLIEIILNIEKAFVEEIQHF